MKLLKEILTCIVFSVSVLITGATLFIAIKDRATGDMNFVAGYRLVYIMSGSMEPGVRTGAIVLLYREDFENIKVGDIVTYEEDGAYITHRVVGVFTDDENPDGDDGTEAIEGERYLVTKGDANNREDDIKIHRDDYRGVVVLVFNEVAPLIRHIRSF
ncbi:MAG: signal peptidase I [Eubacteriales bacterium]|nr:signal peptidase I [Eubacteriales bacterium]